MAACILASIASAFLGMFIISILWEMAPDRFPDALGSFLELAVGSAAGFLGILAGTSLLPAHIRRVGSLVLLGFASTFYFWLGSFSSYVDSGLLLVACFFLLGCLAGVRFFWRRGPDGVISKIVDWLGRYLISAVVSCAIFMAAYFILGVAGAVLSRFISLPASSDTGLGWVGVGSLAVLAATGVLPERQRRFGCLFSALVVGLFYCSFWMSFNGWAYPSGTDFWLLFLGCSLAVVYFWLRKPRPDASKISN